MVQIFKKKIPEKKKTELTPEMMGFKGIIKDFIYLIFNDANSYEKIIQEKHS